MTTSTTLPSPSVRLTVSRPAGVPFGRLVYVEARKLVDTRASLWLLILIALITTGGIALVLFTASPDELTFTRLGLAAAAPQALLLPVLGILASTSEWSQRTGLFTFTLEPRRLRVGAAKLTVALLVSLVTAGLALALGAVANVIGVVWLDGAGTWWVSPERLAEATLLQLISVAQGVAFGAAIGNSAAAIVALFGVPAALMLLSATIAWVEQASRWLDLSVTTSPLLDGSMTAGLWGPLGLSVVIWVLLPLLIGAYRLVRRDIV